MTARFDRRPDRDSNRRDPVREPAKPAAPRPKLNDYWIDGEGIIRAVLQAEICRFLGAEATCRPGDYNGRPGFKIKAQRPFTPEMLEDLRIASRDYRHEANNIQAQGYEEPPYEISETNNRRNHFGQSSSNDRYTPDYHPQGTPFTIEPPTSYQAPSAFTAVGNYPPGTYPVVTGSGPVPGYSAIPGEGQRYPNYTHENPGAGSYNAQDVYYPPGYPYGGQPPREPGIGPTYRGPGGSDMSSGRGAPIDDHRLYYESIPPSAAPPVSGYTNAPFRGPTSPYDPYASAGTGRDNYSSRQGPSSSEYRRR